jgi:xanthine dehydrogenase accessory factor
MSDTNHRSHFEILRDAIEGGVAVSSATIISGERSGSRLILLPDKVIGSLGDSALDNAAVREGRRLLRDELSETRALTGPWGEAEVFFESFPPPPKLIIFGAVHVAQALARIAKELGYRIIVIDNRAKLATRDRFPDADEIILKWPDDALSEMTVEANAAIAILSHDPKFDEPALLGALATPARYIGAVGSRKTNKDRRERLLAAGVDEDSIRRIRGPIGLDIGASTPEEMAISILAEIIAVKHGRLGGPLTSARGNIRARV